MLHELKCSSFKASLAVRFLHNVRIICPAVELFYVTTKQHCETVSFAFFWSEWNSRLRLLGEPEVMPLKLVGEEARSGLMSLVDLNCLRKSGRRYICHMALSAEQDDGDNIAIYSLVIMTLLVKVSASAGWSLSRRGRTRLSPSPSRPKVYAELHAFHPHKVWTLPRSARQESQQAQRLGRNLGHHPEQAPFIMPKGNRSAQHKCTTRQFGYKDGRGPTFLLLSAFAGALCCTNRGDDGW